MLILIAAGLTALVVSAFGWLFEDVAHAVERGFDKAKKYLDEGRLYHD